MQTYSIQIKGMTCGGCASSVQRKLEALPEISQCEVNFATESARIDSAQILHPKQIIDWVRSFGFSVQTEHQVFRASNDQFDEKGSSVYWKKTQMWSPFNSTHSSGASTLQPYPRPTHKH